MLIFLSSISASDKPYKTLLQCIHVYLPVEKSSRAIFVDNTAPSTSLAIGSPKHVTTTSTFVTSNTSFTLSITDGSGSGVASTFYRIWNGTFSSVWLTYTTPFCVTTLANGNYTISYYSIDNLGNKEAEHTTNITLFSWTYVFTDSCRNTTLKINAQYRLFQFTAPGKDFGVKQDRYMIVQNSYVIICYSDSKLSLVASAVFLKGLSLCTCYAVDRQTMKLYSLMTMTYSK